MVQPVLVWDDGESLMPGPSSQAVLKGLPELTSPEFKEETLAEVARHQKDYDDEQAKAAEEAAKTLSVEEPSPITETEITPNDANGITNVTSIADYTTSNEPTQSSYE